MLFFWPCTRHIRCTDMESFWIGKKKKRDKPLSPLPKCASCKIHLVLFFHVEFLKRQVWWGLIVYGFGWKMTDFYSDYKKGVRGRGGIKKDRALRGRRWDVHLLLRGSTRKKMWLFCGCFDRLTEWKGLKKIKSGYNVNWEWRAMRQAQMTGKPFCGHADGFNEGCSYL